MAKTRAQLRRVRLQADPDDDTNTHVIDDVTDEPLCSVAQRQLIARMDEIEAASKEKSSAKLTESDRTAAALFERSTIGTIQSLSDGETEHCFKACLSAVHAENPDWSYTEVLEHFTRTPKGRALYQRYQSSRKFQ